MPTRTGRPNGTAEPQPHRRGDRRTVDRRDRRRGRGAGLGRRHLQAVRRHAGARRRVGRDRGRHHPRPRRRERCRQVDARQDHRRRLRRRQRGAARRRPRRRAVEARRPRWPPASPRSSRSCRSCRPARSPRTCSSASSVRRSGCSARLGARPLPRARRARRLRPARRRAGVVAAPRRPAEGRDHARPRPQRPPDRARRADLVAVAGRVAAPAAADRATCARTGAPSCTSATSSTRCSPSPTR